LRIDALLSSLSSLSAPPSSSPVGVSFSLCADPAASPAAFESTLGREVAFGAHHALHHLAMIRVIAEGPVGGLRGRLPEGFGKAPATRQFEAGKGDPKVGEAAGTRRTPTLSLSEMEERVRELEEENERLRRRP
jgi:hypothetical protein